MACKFLVIKLLGDTLLEKCVSYGGCHGESIIKQNIYNWQCVFINLRNLRSEIWAVVAILVIIVAWLTVHFLLIAGSFLLATPLFSCGFVVMYLLLEQKDGIQKEEIIEKPAEVMEESI